MTSKLSRRTLLARASLTGAGIIAAQKALSQSQCQLSTPQQTEGPFYPVRVRADEDADLTRLEGETQQAQGKVVIVAGTLRDTSCKPIPGALVEIWQACASGRYDHPRDPNPAPLDPHFQYWTRLRTNEEGKFRFKTIVPGAYPAGDGWLRPPHIHVRVVADGYRTLTTQMYFEGEPLNDKDHILQRLSPQSRALVVVPFVDSSEDEAPVGNFGIILSRGPSSALVTPELE